ncbi:MAG: lamin tail domain-containing protein, partial [Chthoniobacteraceae bacterium]
ELDAGDRAAWDQLLALAGTSGFANETTYQRALGNHPDGARDPALPVLLDVPSLIDDIILHIACGADDWPNHNWYAARRRTDPDTGFKFFAWDQEISNNSIQKQHSSWGPLYELVNAPGTPAQLYASARQNTGFKRQFGDRVQELLFNQGPLTQAAMETRWDGLEAVVDKAVVAESARWGDYQRPAQPYKREVEWLAHMNWMSSTYWPQFVSRALIRFRNAGVYPQTDAPNFSQHGGVVAPGFTLTITDPNGNGSIFYTTNSADPAAAGATVYGAPIPIAALVTVRARVRNAADTEWSALTKATFQPPQDLSGLIVSELHYAPADGADGDGDGDGDDFEFIELQNSGVAPLDLTGMRFSEGITFTFPDGTALAPGAVVVIARNPAQFATRFPGVTALGPYVGQLANGGERVTLLDALDETVFSFIYDGDPPWPAAGSGSLHRLAGDPGDPASWFAAPATPGIHAADYDGDGMPNLWEATHGFDPASAADAALDADADGESNAAEFQAGTDPRDAASVLRIRGITRAGDGAISIEFDAVAGKSYRVLTSTDLATWTTLTTVTAQTTAPLSVTDPAPGAALGFYRVVTPP